MSELGIDYFNISWLSREDGPGHRLVLFLQGCSLDCAWCHSPHSQGIKSPLLYFPNLCIDCGACSRVCENGVHLFDNHTHELNRELCAHCGKCIEACPQSTTERGALVLPTKTETVSALFEYIKPQLALLKGIGGLTISGGEPMQQIEAVKELLKLCKSEGMHTAVETSGLHKIEDYKKIAELVDCWLLGFRLTTKGENLHNQFVKRSENTLAFLSGLSGKDVIARIPVIPGHTASLSYYKEVKRLIKVYKISQLELLPYNHNTSHYYHAMGRVIDDKQEREKSKSAFEDAQSYLLTN